VNTNLALPQQKHHQQQKKLTPEKFLLKEKEKGKKIEKLRKEQASMFIRNSEQ
jgi:hypothetical protein